MQKEALFALLKGILSKNGERGMALAALMDEMQDAELESITHSSGDVRGGICLNAFVQGQPVSLNITTNKDFFDSLWVKCNLSSLMPTEPPALTGGAL